MVQAQSSIMHNHIELLLEFVIHENHEATSSWSALEHTLKETFEDIVACELLPTCILKIHIFILHSESKVSLLILRFNQLFIMQCGHAYFFMACL
jgi:hypothetical protein